MHWSSSLSTRLLAAVLITATVAFGLSTGLTYLRLNQGLARQAAQLAHVSEQKLGQELDGEARLVGARIETLFTNLAQRLESIAQRADIAKAVSNANVVEISEILGRAARSADIDGIIVVDAKLRLLGAGRSDLDIVAANRSLREHAIAKEILPILERNDRKHPRTLQRKLTIDVSLGAAIGAESTAPLALLVVEPIFDDFGDVFAALIAHRSLRSVEPTLEEFSQLEGSGVLVMAGNLPISWAGVPNPLTVASVDGSHLLRTSDARHWARCLTIFAQWQVCGLAPIAELYTLRDELVRIGELEGQSLVTWLFIVAAVALVSFVLITLWASRRITRPLAQISGAVMAVARGDWKSTVAGAERKDEVGDIARAVVVLQRSLEERDRLRSDAAYAETSKKRREAVEDAIRRFDRMMRSVLLSVSDCVETMDATARELARMSAVAEGEAAEAAFVSENTASNVSAVRTTTEHLSASIAHTVDQLQRATEVIVATSSLAESASPQANMVQADKIMDEVVRFIEDTAQQTSAVALNAAIQVGRPGGNPGLVVADLKSLAQRMGQANAAIAGRVAEIRGTSNEAVDSVQTIGHQLGLLLRQTRTVVMAIERQDAVTREIVNGMAAAASGSASVSTSIGRLKTTIEEAREASMKVVGKAAEMVDEAHRLDLTVKSFLREVTA